VNSEDALRYAARDVRMLGYEVDGPGEKPEPDWMQEARKKGRFV
jgi:hypothetical protein